jgi:hypothetical protein
MHLKEIGCQDMDSYPALVAQAVQDNELHGVLLKKLTVSQLVNKFPAFYGTRSYMTVFTKARNRSLS